MRFILFPLFIFFVVGCVPPPRSRNIECQTISIVEGKAQADLDLRTLNRRSRRQFGGLALSGIEQEEIRECTVAYVMNDGCQIMCTYDQTVGLPRYGHVGWSSTNWYDSLPSVWVAPGLEPCDMDEVASISVTIDLVREANQKITLALVIHDLPPLSSSRR